MKRSRPIPEVRALLASGLSPIDLEWIGRLKPESQLAAAQKCMNANFTPVMQNAGDRSRLTAGSGHGGRDAR